MNTTSPDTVEFQLGPQRKVVQYFDGETLLDTARRAGITISTSCENGDCGTCMVEPLEGKIEMRQNRALSEDDQRSGFVLACQALPVSDTCKIEVY